jgi:uncharacterized iron-regulated membrane protein
LEAVKLEEVKQPKTKSIENSNKSSLYQTVWRWHFYAGIFFAPLIIFFAITGGIYLFKPQIESYMYHDLYYVQQGQQVIPTTKQIDEVKKHYPNTKITSFKPSFEAKRSSEVGLLDNGESVTAYVNPYNGDILGSINDSNRFMATVKELHNGEVWGAIGNRVVELAGCWAIILIITGSYLWWPRNRKSLFGTLIPRIRLFKGKRMLWRDIHSVTAIWLSLFIIIQSFSGLMWSEIFGGIAHRVVEATNMGSPVGDQPWEKFAFPKSTIPTKEVADVPWAAENMPLPKSSHSGLAPITIENVIQIAKNNNVHPGYNIGFPEGKTGVYTVYLDPADVYPNTPMPWTQKTLHIDQYSGKVLGNFGWKDYGFLGKLITLGIAFHQGEFGLLSQLFMLALMGGIVLIAFSGLLMWWKRRPNGKLGAPSIPENFKMLRGVVLIVLVLSLFFPLVGLSLIVVWILDWLVIKRIPLLKQIVG